MKIQTARFGELEVDPNLTYTFAHGLPGFEQLRQFLLIPAGEDIPFYFIQSIEDGKVSFIVTNPFAFFPDYEFQLPEAILEELHIRDENDVVTWSIVSIQDHTQDMTLNLLAPVILNVRTKQGRQIILHGSGYTTKHKVTLVEDETASAAEKEAGSC